MTNTAGQGCNRRAPRRSAGPAVWALPVLLLAGCGNPGAAPKESNAAADMSALLDEANLAAAARPTMPALPPERVRDLLAAQAAPGEEITVATTRPGVGGATCGEAERRGGTGGAPARHPYVVTPSGRAAISRLPFLALHDTTDPFPDLYIRWCASPEELRALEAEAGALEPLPLPDPLPAPDPALPAGSPPPQAETGPATLPPIPPPARPAPAPAAPEEPGRTKSFSEAVLRPQP